MRGRGVQARPCARAVRYNPGMARASPLLKLHQEAEAALRVYGPPSSDPGDTIHLVETFGDLDLEYAALRKHCVLLDQPHRGVLELKGADRLDFLNRMVTQDLKGIPPFSVRRAFWLNRKGRIDSDLRIIDLPSRTLLDMDAHAVERTLAGLSAYIISEDVAVRDITRQTHRLALHGPTSTALLRDLADFSTGADASGPALPDLTPDRACTVAIAGHEVVVDRDDATGEIGLELTVASDAALDVFRALIDAGADRETGAAALSPTRSAALAGRVRLRRAGWHAFNIARIENGRPLYNIDFTPDSLPAETGVFADRVSLTKGCYLGQEIVARMHSRGHPKRVLVSLALERRIDAATGEPLQPESAAFVHLPRQDDRPGEAVGVVTSSAVSPLMGGTPVCFAQVKFEHAGAGTGLEVAVGTERLRTTVRETLRFVER